MRVALIAEQLRRPVPGGIGTYVRGLLQGSVGLPDRSVWVEPRQWRAPVPLVTRAWERGWFGVRDHVDVVHAPALAFPPTEIPLVVTIHGLEWRDPQHGAPARARRWHEDALTRAVSAGALLLASSPELATLLRSEGALRATTLDGPLYGCDHLPPRDDDGAAAVLDRLGVEEQYVLSVGTLEPRKNLPRLVEAFERVRPRLPAGCRLVLVGPAGWGPGLPVAEAVHLAGPVSDAVLAGLYARATAVVYVPLHEGFGLPAVEAMRAGAPVVASAVPSIGDAALVVDPGDVSAIGEGLVRVVTDEDTRAELIARGTAHAGLLTWARAAERHADLWDQLRRGTR
jgi:glycosyltransferase involved in cell wall biosynthesis